MLWNRNYPFFKINMPANKKYLSSPLQRFLKITAGLIGGFIVTQVFHMFLAVWWTAPNALMTIRFAGFVLWAVLLVLAFLAKNGRKTWSIYLLISLVLIVLTYLKQPFTI